ncbi:type IX secretion system membrane protein PorP/SprF [Flavobacteriaceae bacterium]|nr:type IX secretion system membrane protein PorP/SprF [Flavobacteriaceae bacterium]
MKNIPYNSLNSAYFSFLVALIVWAAAINSSKVYAQQDSQYTNYMYNTQVINPAYAGSREQLSALLLYRNQWVGIDGAPTTYNFGLHTPVGQAQRLGLGLNFFKDEIGPADESNITADVSYAIPVSSSGTKLAFGVKGGINLLNIDYNKLKLHNESDNSFENNINNRLTPTVGLGLFLYNTNRWYMGLSTPNLLETTHYDDVKVSNVTEKMHLFATAGYVFDLSSSTKFKPAVMAKMVSGAPLALDLSANFLFNEKFTLGAAYRWSAAVSALAGFQVSDSVMIGYAYDYGLQELANYNSGSHEVFLRFEIGGGSGSNARIITPRFF